MRVVEANAEQGWCAMRGERSNRSWSAFLVWVLCLALVAGGLALTTAEAQGAAKANLPRLVANASGSDNTAIGTLNVISGPRVSCVARLKRAGHAARLGRLRTGAGGGGEWQWTVARSAPGGTWTAAVTCGEGRAAAGATTRFAVPSRPGRSRGRVRLVVRSSVRARGTTTFADKRGGNGAAGANPYPSGQCTWYVWSKRPDLPWFPGHSGDAKNWIASANARGIPTGTTPVVGAVAVMQPGQYGSGVWGHVAYVEAVSGGTITISEANYGGYRPGHRRTISAAGLRFIYGGPARAPGSSQPAPTPTPEAAPAGTFRHRVYHTCANGSCGLRTRKSPNLSAEVAGVKNDGDVVDIVCQTTGDRVYGKDGSSSTVWDKLFDGSFVSDYYVDTPGVGGAFSPPIPQCSASTPPPPPPPVTGPVAVTHYNCPAVPNAFGHYLPAGTHWGNDFTAQGTTITSGWLTLGSNTPQGARIGIYTGGPNTLSGELGAVEVTVSGYGGVNFTFSPPVTVTPGQRLWLAATSRGPMTAYDRNDGGVDGCFQGGLAGFK